MNRERPDIARLGFAGACATLATAATVILLYRHAAPLLAALLAYALTVPLFWSQSRWPRFLNGLKSVASSTEGVLLAAFAGMCLASAALSPAGGRALEYWLEMTAAGLVFVVIAVAARHVADERLFRWLLIGLVAAGALLLGDLLTEHRFRSLAGVVTRGSDSNRAAVLAALCAPLMIVAIARGGSLRLIGALALLLTLATTYLSHSTSAKLALAVGLIAHLAVAQGGRKAALAAGAAAAGIVLLMPLVAGLVYEFTPRSVYGLSDKISAEARAVIWEGFARLVALKPWFGYGFEAGAIADRLPQAAVLEGRMREYMGIGHPHNAPLQIWFELGMVGAALAAILVWLGFRRIADAPAGSRPAAAAVACGVFAVACVSHGAWQAWWPLMIALIVAGFPRASREAA